MSAYVNKSVLESLFEDVEMKAKAEARINAINALTTEFTNLALDSLERIAYDLIKAGWTVQQVAHEIGVSRNYIPRMADAYANRAGHLSPFPRNRRYAHAVDISALVTREARRRAAEEQEAQ